MIDPKQSTADDLERLRQKSVAALGFDLLAVLEGQGDAIASELRAVRARLAVLEAAETKAAKPRLRVSTEGWQRPAGAAE